MYIAVEKTLPEVIAGLIVYNANNSDDGEWVAFLSKVYARVENDKTFADQIETSLELESRPLPTYRLLDLTFREVRRLRHQFFLAEGIETEKKV